MASLVEFFLAHGFWVWVAAAAAILALEIAFGSGWLLLPAARAAWGAVRSLSTHNATL